jgi:hypothetical protein
MASTDNKLYVALGVLAVLGGTLYVVNKNKKEEAAQYTLSGQNAALPKIAFSDEDLKGIDKIVLKKPAGEDGGAPKDIELVKKGEEWRVSKPVDALANQANVKSLLDNLKALKPSEMIDSSPSSYDKFGVSEGKALHATFMKGDAKAFEAYFGENGGRGQMTRIAGKDGVFAIKGYSSYLYDREVKGWRDTTVFKFEDTAVNAATIDNEHGSFSFTKSGEAWKGTFKPAKGGAAKDIERFDEAKVKDFLRAYKGLNASDFAEAGKTPADLGLDKPAATVVITLNDGAKRELKVGATAEGSARWAQASGVTELVSISSWTADWALAEPKKFQKAEDKKEGAEEGDAHEGAHGMPGTPPPTTPAASAKPAAPAAPKPAAPAAPAAPKPAAPAGSAG